MVARSSSLTAWDSGREEEDGEGNSPKFTEKHEYEVNQELSVQSCPVQ